MIRNGLGWVKTFIMEVKTDDLTKGTFSKADFEVTDVKWLPLMHEAPRRNPFSYAWNNFVPVILNLKVSCSSTFTYDFSTNGIDYMDYYNEKSFNIIKGQENTITLTVSDFYE